MIDIKDVAGISEPLKRLIEVVAEGIGTVARPLLAKTIANAKAYEIRTIAQAISESQNMVGGIKYDGGNVVIESSASNDIANLPDAEIDQRVLARLTYQQVKKQSNIENVVEYAADNLKSEQEIVKEKPDADWITRFFNITEDISADHMQILWGKILAGEIKRPGSYSLRALELLKNINQKEAELFVKAGEISIMTGDKAVIPYSNQGKYLEEKFGLSFSDLLVLREVGLLVINDLAFTLKFAEEEMQVVFTLGNTCILIDRPKGSVEQTMSCIAFTEIGKQLLQLIEKHPADPEYVKHFSSFWRGEGVTIKSGIIVEWGDGYIRYQNLQEVPA